MTLIVIQSSEKSLDVLVATSIMRTRKFAFESWLTVQVRPQLSEALPSVYVCSVVVNVPVCLAVVQLLPPFQDSCTQSFGAPLVLSTLASNLTSIPEMIVPGIVIP